MAATCDFCTYVSDGLSIAQCREEMLLYRKNIAARFVLTLLIVHIMALCAFAASDRIGFIDTQRVLSSHPKYDAAQKQIEAFVKKKSETARTAAEKETDAKKRAEIIDKARKESGEEERKIMNPLTVDLNNTIASVAKNKGVTVVLNKILIYFGGVDLTDDVVKALKNIK